jgi:hypothetical protein
MRIRLFSRPMIAALAGAGVAWGGLSYIALTIGVLAEGYRFSLPQAALLATIELGAMALAAMSGGYALRVVSVRQLAIAGGVIAGLANISTALATQLFVVGAARSIAGLGFGFMAAGLNTSVSRSQDPERLFILANFGCITIAAAFFYVMPMLYEHTSFPAYFIAYGLMCLGCAALMRWLPDGPQCGAARQPTANALVGRRIGVLLAVGLVWLCYAAVWSLIERFGREIGMTEESVGRSLGLGTLSGLVGAGAAAWLAGRIRPLGPLIFTSLTTGLCYIWLALCHGATEYTWILCVWGVVFCPILAYAFAVATEIDPSGALGRLISGATAITTALGPVAGARLEGLFGYRGVAIATFLGTAIACVVFAALGPRAGRISLSPNTAKLTN